MNRNEQKLSAVLDVLDDFRSLAMQERNDGGATEREIGEARATIVEMLTESAPMGPAEIAAMIVCYAIVIVPLVACLYFTFAGG